MRIFLLCLIFFSYTVLCVFPFFGKKEQKPAPPSAPRKLVWPPKEEPPVVKKEVHYNNPFIPETNDEPDYVPPHKNFRPKKGILKPSPPPPPSKVFQAHPTDWEHNTFWNRMQTPRRSLKMRNVDFNSYYGHPKRRVGLDGVVRLREEHANE